MKLVVSLVCDILLPLNTNFFLSLQSSDESDDSSDESSEESDEEPPQKKPKVLYLHVSSAFEYFVSPAYCSSAAAKPATKVSKKESSSDEDSEEESDKQAKTPNKKLAQNEVFLQSKLFYILVVSYQMDF